MRRATTLLAGLLAVAALAAGCAGDCDVACGKLEVCDRLLTTDVFGCVDACEGLAGAPVRTCADCLDGASCRNAGACDPVCADVLR